MMEADRTSVRVNFTLDALTAVARSVSRLSRTQELDLALRDIPGETEADGDRLLQAK